MDRPPRPVVYKRAARAHLDSIERYIARESDPVTAADYVSGIMQRCDLLGSVPYLGPARGDASRGLRTIAHKRRVTIAYKVESTRIVILAVLYGGRDLDRHVPD